MDRLKKFFTNGILMTAVALLMRYISVQFNIYIAEKIGSVAMGIFTLIMSVYGFCITLAASGIGLATTKLVSEALGEGSRDKRICSTRTADKIMKKSILFSLLVSISVCFLLFVLAPFIGNKILGDERTVSSLRILAFSLPPIALSASLGGYFSALRRVYKNALSQILCQGVRIYLCALLLSLAVAKDIESACIAIAIATTVSELLSLALEALMFLYDRARAKKQSALISGEKGSRLPEKLLKITLPVSLSAYVRSALVTVEHLLIPWGLEKSGDSRDASLSAYGTVHSLVFPLVLFPSAISSAFAGLLVPEISESDAMGDGARIERIISRVLKTVLIFSVGVCGIMLGLSGEFGRIVLKNADSAKYIAYISPLIPIMYLDTSVDSILKGLGHQFYCMIINIVDATLSVILVIILLPRFGIMGYIMTVYFTEVINAALSLTKLLCISKAKIKLLDLVVKPVACSIIGVKLCRLLWEGTEFIIRDAVKLTVDIIIFSAIYFLLLILCRAVRPKEVARRIKSFFKKEKRRL